MYIYNINLFKSLFIITIFLSGFFILLNPISASEIHIFPGDNIVTKIGSAVSGDTVYIHAGTYYITSRIIVRQSNIKIIGENPINTIIEGNGIVERCIDATNRDYITIENLTLKNSYRLIEFRDNSTVNNCILYGKNTGGHSTLVGKDNCKVMNTIVTGGKWDGIRIENNGYVFNCLSFNNGDNGIQVGANSYVLSCTSANNGIRPDAGDSSGIVARLTASNAPNPLLDNLTVRDCIVINNLGNSNGNNLVGGIAANSGTISYTNIYNCKGSPIGLTIGPGVIYEDPKLIDGVSSFYLNPFSPAVDRGSDTSKNIGLYEGFTTRSDQYWDILTVDMGFHYNSGEGPLVENKTKPMDQIIRILNLNTPKNIGEIIEDCESNPDAEGCKPSQ